MNNFTTGRKISNKENSDVRISLAIDSIIAKEDTRAQQFLKNGMIDPKEISNLTPRKSVFQSFNLRDRSDNFYKAVANDITEMDSKRDKKYGFY
jgi:hypothetical protein